LFDEKIPKESPFYARVVKSMREWKAICKAQGI